MKTKVLVDSVIECEPPRHLYRWNRTPEELSKEMEAWCREFEEFVRDHRSQDPVQLTVRRVYKDICDLCRNEWEVDSEGPVCCEAALAAWKAAKVAA